MTDLSLRMRFKKFSQDWDSYTLAPGLNVIYGGSGVGKSSLLDMIQGKPEKDSLNFEADVRLDETAVVYRIFHNPDHQIIASTVSNEITFSGECQQLEPKKLKQILDRNLRLLPDHIDPMMNPGYLSGGEKELLNLVTALDFEPGVLLVDDGLSFLSKENKHHCLNLMSEWTERTRGVIVWVTSDHEDLKHGDRTLVLSLESLSDNEPGKILKYDDITLPDGSMTIEIKDLTYGYMGQRDIYRDLSMEIEGVRSLGLIGNNGSGKTTFAGLCFGDLSPVKGLVNITVGGVSDIKVGYLDQFPEHLILLKTPEELLADLKQNEVFFSSMEGTLKKRLNRFGIRWTNVADIRGVDLPWVVLRLLLLIVLCHCNFNVLILDEPTFGLGWDQRVKLRTFIRECMNRMHFMIVSHDVEFIRSICDHVIDLDEMDSKHVKTRTKEKTKS
ncbi:MAG: ATP-binding cassette domain-containing protein [Candidatus Neomarinimicrobiota bacterium]|tara:strand:+ start:12342 stop:13670 length:1329 start_codon:yes stop_codon:yes gene_type:complete